PSCRGLMPEPIRQRCTVDGAVPRLRCEGLTVVGFEILHGVSEECGKGDIGAWIKWRLAIEKSTDERPHLLWCQPADTDRGAAASGHSELVPCAELRNLALQGRPQEVCIAQILGRGREADWADQGRGGVCGRRGVIREIDEHGPIGGFE